MIYCSNCGMQNQQGAQYCAGCGNKLIIKDAIPQPVAVTGSHTPSTTNIHNRVVVIGNQKSAGVAFILAFLFGPLGLLYASVSGGLIMLFVSFVGLLFFPLLIISWVGSMIWAISAVGSHNNSMTNKANNIANS